MPVLARTDMRILLPIFLLVAVSVKAQLPILQPMLQTASVVAGPVPFMPNLAEYWEFTDTTHILTTNAAVTNWIGKLQGTILTNGATAKQPTNSASGVGFDGTRSLTNVPFLVNTNWTITIFYQFTGTFSDLQTAPASLYGSNTPAGNLHGWCVFGDQNGNPKQNLSYDTANALLQSTSPFPIPSQIIDFSLCMSNVNTAGRSFYWTNGIFIGSPSGFDTAPESLSFIGNGPVIADALTGAFKGYIQALYIQTNYAATTVNASNIHYYRTNIFTPGATP